jgi:hypothetical protein
VGAPTQEKDDREARTVLAEFAMLAVIQSEVHLRYQPSPRSIRKLFRPRKSHTISAPSDKESGTGALRGYPCPAPVQVRVIVRGHLTLFMVARRTALEATAWVASFASYTHMPDGDIVGGVTPVDVEVRFIEHLIHAETEGVGQGQAGPVTLYQLTSSSIPTVCPITASRSTVNLASLIINGNDWESSRLVS